jgi:hypothetical protein
MISPSVQPPNGSDTNTSRTTNSSNNNISFPSDEDQQQEYKTEGSSFPELYRKTLTSVPPHNYGKSDAVESNFVEQWTSTSLPEDEDSDLEVDIPMQHKNPVETDTTSSSGPGSGDILSDEDRERLGSIQRGENNAIVGWLKNIGNHKSGQRQHSHEGTMLYNPKIN